MISKGDHVRIRREGTTCGDYAWSGGTVCSAVRGPELIFLDLTLLSFWSEMFLSTTAHVQTYTRMNHAPLLLDCRTGLS